jgi:hypothetical protein
MSVFVAVVGLVASAAFLACAHAVAKADELALEDEVPGAGHWINQAGTSFAGISLPVLQTIGSAALFTRFAWYVTETAYDAAIGIPVQFFITPIVLCVVYVGYIVLSALLWKRMRKLEDQFVDWEDWEDVVAVAVGGGGKPVPV